MAKRLTYLWLSNVLVSNKNSFKDQFYFEYDDQKTQQFETLLKQHFVSQVFTDLMTYLSDKLTLVNTPLIIQVARLSDSFSETFWKAFLEQDLKIESYMEVDGCDTDCKTCLLEILIHEPWEKKTLEKIATILKQCKDNGYVFEYEKSSLFPFLFDNNLKPVDFPFGAFSDYLAGWLTLGTYFINAACYSILVYLDDIIQYESIEREVHESWKELVKTLFITKFTDNIYDEDKLKRYLFVSYLFKHYNEFLKLLLDHYASDVDTWEFIHATKHALLETIRELAKTVVQSTDDLESIIENFDVSHVFNTYYNTIASKVKWSLKQFDTSKLRDYFQSIKENSSNEHHIHEALYPIWQVILELNQDKPDYLGILYNSLKSIHNLSNFSVVNLDDYVVSNEDDTSITPVPNKDQWLNELKFLWKTYISSQIKNDILQWQAEDWFYEVYVRIFKIVAQVLEQTYFLLLAPLLGELRSRYNLISLELIQQTLESSTFIALNECLQKSFSQIVSISHTKRAVDHTLLENSLEKLSQGTPLDLTKIFQSVVSSILESYTNFVSFDKAKIKDAIMQTLYNNTESTALKFDVLSGNLKYLQNFDSHFTNFINSFLNKMNFELTKARQQIEHSFIGLAVQRLLKLDSLGYVVYPLLVPKAEWKQLEFILLGLKFSAVIRTKAVELMNIPFILNCIPKLVDDILQTIQSDDTMKRVFKSVMMI